MGADVAFRLLTRFSRLTVASSGTTPGASGIFTVDGAALPAPPGNVVVSAPFAPRLIEAVAGELAGPGVRSPFIRWADAPSEPRVRPVTTPLTDSTYVAEYGGTQYQLLVDLVGGVNGVAPGTIQTTPASPDLWFAPSTGVSISAVPQTGFTFLSWSGALAGQPNPASVVMSAPVTGGASFQLVYSVADVQLSLTATEAQDVQLVVANGTSPFAWSVVTGVLPTGIRLSSAGRLTGASLDVGSFPLTVEAVDALGLVGSATLTLDVTEPSIPVADLASRFLLSGAPLDALQEEFLDHQGNGVGGFDLGDFRAWVLAHPALPLSTPIAPVVTQRTVVVPLRLESRSADR